MFKFSISLIILSCSVGLSEVWRCDGLTYANAPISGKSCVLLVNYPVCGHSGNRFIAPSREGLKDASNSCQQKEPSTDKSKSSSPFVNAAFVEAYKDYKAPPTKRWTEPSQTGSSSKSDDFSFGDPKLPDIGVFQDILKIITNAKNSIEKIP